MLPLRDDNPTRTTPIVTIALIVVNVVVFLYELMYGLEATTLRFGLIPAELVHGADQVYAGARLGLPPGTGVENFNPAWTTVFTSMFMHGGWGHILSNMWFLWIFGNNVEDDLGHIRYLLFYLLCGIGAAAAQVLMGPASPIPMVGASGAIAGVLGAYLVLFPHSRVLCLTYTLIITTFELPAALVLGFWFVLQLISGLGVFGRQAGGVAYAAHIGGFVLGWLLIRLLAAGPRPPQRRAHRPSDYDWR